MRKPVHLFLAACALAVVDVLFPSFTSAQVLVQARVVDAFSGEAIPFCTVVVKGEKQGVLTNSDGAFQLWATSPNDSLTLAFMGHGTRTVSVGSVLNDPVIRLTASGIELRPLEVTRNDKLYRLMAESGQRLRKHHRYHSKLYFELETHSAGQAVEVVEAYYNATFDGPLIEGLDLKNGRIGMAPVDGRYFVSLNTTKAIAQLDVARDMGSFPGTPFQGSAKEVRKHFDLTLEGVQAGATPLYRIRFAPRVNDGTRFTGIAWLDTATLAPHRIELTCSDCSRHPFIPLWEGPKLDSVQLHFTQGFALHNGRPELDLVTLDYTLRYTSERRDDVIRSTGVMHVFDRGGAFILPLFDYDAAQDDYRKITFLPYDSAFWTNAHGLLRTDQQQRDLDFFATHGNLVGHGRELLKQARFFESNYAFWAADKRIGMKHSFARKYYDEELKHPQRSVAPAASQVELKAQLFLAMDTANGTLRTFSATVFDGFKSYWLIPEEPETDCYINLFFDLCEMERRRMMERLAGVNDVAQARRIHHEATKEMERTTERFRKECSLGHDRKALARWNTIVKDALYIDNMALFGSKSAP